MKSLFIFAIILAIAEIIRRVVVINRREAMHDDTENL